MHLRPHGCETLLSDLAAEEPQEAKETAREPAARSNGRSNNGRGGNGRARQDAEVAEELAAPPVAFDLAEDLTPYEFKTITRSVAGLDQPASYVQIFGSIRELDERGELELSQEEIREVIEAMLDAEYLKPERVKPYKEAKANGTFYALDHDREEIKAVLNGA